MSSKYIFIFLLCLFYVGCIPENNQLVHLSSCGVDGDFFVKSKQADGKIYSELYDDNGVIAVSSLGFYMNTETTKSFLYNGIPLILKSKLENNNSSGNKNYFTIPGAGEFILIQELFCNDEKIAEWKSAL